MPLSEGMADNRKIHSSITTILVIITQYCDRHAIDTSLRKTLAEHYSNLFLTTPHLVVFAIGYCARS